MTKEKKPLLGVREKRPRGYACHPDTERGVGSGRAKKSKHTLRQLHKLLFVCPTCAGLVRVTDAVGKAGKGNVVRIGTGCGGPGHHKKVELKRYNARQTKHAQGLRDGVLHLIPSVVGLLTSEIAEAAKAVPPKVAERVAKRILGE